MRTKLILFSLSTLLLYNFRIWIIRQISKAYKQKIRIHTIVIGILGSISIWWAPKLFPYFWVSWDFSSGITYQSIGIYILYLTSIALLFFFIYNQSIKTKFLKHLGIFIGICCCLGLGLYAEIPEYLLYFSLVAFVEEYIKFNLWYSLFEKFQIHYTDLLLFCILSGLGFSLIENIAYGIQSFQWEWVSSLIDSSQIILKRNITNIGLHAIFTGIIGYFTLSNQEKLNTKKILTGMLLWVWIHLVFNLISYREIKILIPIFVLGGYIGMTFLLYNSDSFYRKDSQ